MDQSTPQPANTASFQLSLLTPAGRLETSLNIPTAFIPIRDIVPQFRRIGEEALALEQDRSRETGRSIACRNGCAACCRMLVPVSPPEAFALADALQRRPEQVRGSFRKKIEDHKERLAREGLLSTLVELSDTTRDLSDQEIEPVNQAYYDLRLPCPFLEYESCSIYEDRPAACRELLVTSPAELCQDLAANPVEWLPVPLRISTILSLLWSSLVGGPLRFIPLPLALDWVATHEAERNRTWEGNKLIEEGLDKIWQYLSQEFTNRGIHTSPPPPDSPSPPSSP